MVALWGAMKVAGNRTSFLSDRIGREKAFTSGCLASILGLLMLVLVQEKSYNWILLLYAVFFGLGTGMSGPVLGAAVADIFYGKSFGSINESMALGFGLGGIVGPWFGGFVFDTTKSYSGALVAVVLIVFVACAFLWIGAPRKVRNPG